MTILNNSTGGPATLAADGGDTHIDLALSAKGANGRVRFGTFAGTGDVACNGYIEIKDAAGNVRKLMTTA